VVKKEVAYAAGIKKFDLKEYKRGILTESFNWPIRKRGFSWSNSSICI